MSAAINLARPDDLAALLPLVAAFHEEAGLETTDEMREAAIGPLLDDSPFGCIYLIGPRRTPIGYVAITFGWSLESGGLEGTLDEVFVRRRVRGRDVATEALARILPLMDEAGVRALHLKLPGDDTRLQKLYARAGFRLRDSTLLMTRRARV